MKKTSKVNPAVKVFDFICYKEFLRTWIKKQAHGGHGQSKRISEHLRIHTTQFSQVLKSDRELSPEQAVLLAEFLKFSSLESDYLLQLVLSARAGSEKLRKSFAKRLAQLRSEYETVSHRMSTGKELSLADQTHFYSTWKTSAIRLAASLPSCKTVRSIAEVLKLPLEYVEKEIEFLLKAGLVIEVEDGFILGHSHTHVSKKSDLVDAHHRNWRLRNLAEGNHGNDSNLTFTALASMSKSDFLLFRKQLLNLIDEFKSVVGPSSPETLAIFAFDYNVVI